MDMARQVWDESRHVETYLGCSTTWPATSAIPETTLCGAARAPRIAARVAGVNRGLEGLLRRLNQLIHIARKDGVPSSGVRRLLLATRSPRAHGLALAQQLTRKRPERRRAPSSSNSIDTLKPGGTRQNGHHEVLPISIPRTRALAASRRGDRAARQSTQRSQVTRASSWPTRPLEGHSASTSPRGACATTVTSRSAVMRILGAGCAHPRGRRQALFGPPRWDCASTPTGPRLPELLAQGAGVEPPGRTWSRYSI